MASDSDQGQILVLVMNELGDNQMETYFQYSAGGGGILCWDETMSPESDPVFGQMTNIHELAMQAVGGQYMPQNHEQAVNYLPQSHKRPCAIRLARNVFFEVSIHDKRFAVDCPLP